MKVDPNSTVVNVSNKQNENNSVKADDPSQKNKQSASSVVNFSSEAELMAQIHSELQKVPDVRTEKVNEIRAQIEAGTYGRDSEEVAEKLITDVLMMSLFDM